MTGVDHWLQQDPWDSLKGLPQKCAARLGRTVAVVGRELEARLRDGRLPSRIRPSQVVLSKEPPTPPETPRLDLIRGVSTSNPRPSPAPTTWPPTSTKSTIEGNGGWDQIDWSEGTIHQLRVEVHWPSVEQMLKDLQNESQRLPRAPGQKDTTKRAAVEAAMRAKIDSGQMSLADLNAIPKKQLPVMFNESETTCYEARKRVLGQAGPTTTD